MLKAQFEQNKKISLRPKKVTLPKGLIEKIHSELMKELYQHGGKLQWFRGQRTAGGNFENELATTDGQTLWLNQDFYSKAPNKALALAGHLFMHMVQWNNDIDQLDIARIDFIPKVSRGEKIPPVEFTKAYSYEKNAWEMFLGFLLSVTPPNFEVISRTWLQRQFEEDMFSVDPDRPGLAFAYGALNSRTGEFHAEYNKDIATNGLDRQLRVDQSGVAILRSECSFRKISGMTPYILNTGTEYRQHSTGRHVI